MHDVQDFTFRTFANNYLRLSSVPHFCILIVKAFGIARFNNITLLLFDRWS